MTYISECPVGCNKDFITTAIRLQEGALLECLQCGQLVSQCSESRYWDSMKEFDSEEGTSPQGSAKLRSFTLHKMRLQRAGQLLNKPLEGLQLLDIGCSSGAFLHSALKLGICAQGVEPAPKAACAAKEAGLSVHQGRLEEQNFADNTYDIVTLFEVIEHLKSPVTVLEEAFRVLKSGGVMIVGTGNAHSWTAGFMRDRWEYYQIDQHGGHISFYNPYSIRQLATRVGFEVVEVKTRRVRFYERGQINNPVYKLTKLCAELLNLPATVLRKGHDMCVYMRKPL